MPLSRTAWAHSSTATVATMLDLDADIIRVLPGLDADAI
jgi:hypothetical protein